MRIQQLYREGRHFTSWPLRVTWMFVGNPPSAPGNQILVWAPKSLFKHAVDRNRLRRLMREAYRLHQDMLTEHHFLIAFNYMDKEEQSFPIIEKAVCKALKKINNHQ